MHADTQPVGLDNGNAFTKLVAGHRDEFMFPSAVAPFKPAPKAGTLGLKANYRDDSGEYLVGQAAIDHGAPTYPALDSRRYSSPEYRVTGMHALMRAGVRNADIVCGLPVGHYSEFREPLVRTVMGWAKHDSDIQIRRVQVLIEPHGAYFDKMLDLNGQVVNHLGQVDVGIVDIGGHTLDISEVKKGKAVIDRHVCLPTGAIHAYQTMLHQLQHRYPKNSFSIHEIPAIMRSQKVSVFGKEASVADLVKQAQKSIVGSVLSGIKEMWGEKTGHLQFIILTGGPAPLIQEEMLKSYPHIEVPENPLMANARGFYKFAVFSRRA